MTYAALKKAICDIIKENIRVERYVYWDRIYITNSKYECAIFEL